MRCVSTSRSAALALALVAAAASGCTIDLDDAQSGAAGSTPRQATTFRQRYGEREITARVHLSQGSLRTAASRPGELYRVDMAYDGARPAPAATFRPDDGVLLVGQPAQTTERTDKRKTTVTIDGVNLRFDDGKQSARQSTALAIAPDVDVALELLLTDVESDLELGGRRLSSADVTSSIGRTTIRFSHPNRIACERLGLTSNVDAASLLGLGNSRCRKVSVHSTVAGETVLDFGGDWRSDMSVDVVTAAGSLTLRLPRDAGVRLTARTVLASLESSGLVRDGNTFVSRTYQKAAHRIDIDLSATLGSVSVEWIGE